MMHLNLLAPRPARPAPPVGAYATETALRARDLEVNLAVLCGACYRWCALCHQMTWQRGVECVDCATLGR